MEYKDLIEKEIEYIKKIPIESIDRVVNSIHHNLFHKDRIVTTGLGKAGQIAHTLATTLSSTGRPSFFLHPTEAQHGDLGIICPGDIIIFFSNSGKTREVLELIDLINNLEYSNKIYGVVGKIEETIRSKCADVIEFGEVEEICPLGLTPTTSTTCMSVISDLIVVGLMGHKQFTKSDYGKTHHGGYLHEKSRS